MTEISKRVYMENQLIIKDGFYVSNKTYNFQYVAIELSEFKLQHIGKYQQCFNSFSTYPIFFFSNNPNIPDTDIYVWFKLILPTHINLLQHKSFKVIMNKDMVTYKDEIKNSDITNMLRQIVSRWHNEYRIDVGLETAIITTPKLLSLLSDENQ